MPTYQFEAMDARGEEIKDTIVAESEAEAQATIRQMGYFVTKIGRKREGKEGRKKKWVGKSSDGFRQEAEDWANNNYLNEPKRHIRIIPTMLVFGLGLVVGLVLGLVLGAW